MTATRCSLALVALFAVGCPDEGDGEDAGQDAAVLEDAQAPDTTVTKPDAEVVVHHDGGGPTPCTTTCDCPQGAGCVQGECRQLGTPVYCCDKEGCPGGQQCLDSTGAADVCSGDPDPGDAGPGPDTGPRYIGEYCENDLQCDQTLGLTCWERNEPPGVWGYCAREGCQSDLDCPTLSVCIQFGNPPVLTGCMRGCNVDGDCRTDAHCYPIPGLSTFTGICIPDCRDDFLDCRPRDGTVFCDPSTGRWVDGCAFTPLHDDTAQIGDACTNSTQCATGDVCLSQFGWGYSGGMCTRLCQGEAVDNPQPCSAGSTCQMLPAPNNALGLCFKDCTGGSCPNRPISSCTTLDPGWSAPGCIPPIIP